MNRIVAGSAAALLLPAGVAAVMLALPAEADTESTAAATPGAAASTDTGGAASPEMLAAMQRDLGLTADGAKDRIVKDRAASRTERTLRKKLGSTYGGAWLTADAKSFVVAVTDSDKADEVTAAGGTPKLVSRSAEKLDDIKADLDRVAAEAPPESVPGWYVDPKTNTVVVQARGGKDAAEALIEASGADPSAVRVVETTQQPELLDDVRGGDQYFVDGGTSCSVGFAVEGGFVTAGHCGKKDSKTQGPKGSKNSDQGVFAVSSFPDDDYAYVEVNRDWTPQPWVDSGRENILVAGSAVASVGASVCRSGATSGWHCGLILSVNETVNYKDGSTVKGLTKTNVCAEHGDSGGAFISGQQAQGVTSGGTGDCSEEKPETYFQPIGEILTAAGKKLLTEQPTGCTDYKYTARGSVEEKASSYQPDGSYYTSKAGGTHSGCLDGPTGGADFDLYLQKWDGTKSVWETVAQGTTTGADEKVTFEGVAGYYRWRVRSYSGAGNFAFGYTAP